MTNCKVCGAKMYNASTTEDKMLLICTKNPEHRLEREISLREKINKMRRTMSETPFEVQRKRERALQREKQKSEGMSHE